MQKIGSGYYYDVFDLGNGRVFKKKRGFFDIAKSMRGKDRAFFKYWMAARKYVKECERETEMMRSMLVSFPVKLFGSPVFVNRTDYEQDKVVLIMDYTDTHSLEENKIVIDKYIQLIEVLLGYGVHDKVYKFKNSYGLNTVGELVFIDFNEVTFSKNQVLKLVREEKWKNEAQFKKYNEGELKEYLRLRLAQTMTEENINRLWGTMLKS